jgi:hypothetical protein
MGSLYHHGEGPALIGWRVFGRSMGRRMRNWAFYPSERKTFECHRLGYLKMSTTQDRTIGESVWSSGLFFFYNRWARVAKLRRMVE